MEKMIRYDGKVVAVTGGSGGIGLSVCEELARLGAKVVLIYSRKDASGVMKHFDELGLPVEYLRMDVADGDSVRQGAKTVQDKYGGADMLVTAAGVAQTRAAFDYTDEEWRKTQAINLDGTFYCAREFGRQMRDKGKGAMVFIGSIAAMKAVRPETHASYGTSKAAVNHLARLLASEWAGYGIRVNSISPGYVDTDILRGVGSSSPETMEMWLGQSPMHRLIKPVEIARVTAFLGSDLASAITGANLMVDGGYTCW